jgi:hypothetical protein
MRGTVVKKRTLQVIAERQANTTYIENASHSEFNAILATRDDPKGTLSFALRQPFSIEYTKKRNVAPTFAWVACCARDSSTYPGIRAHSDDGKCQLVARGACN